LEKDKDGKFPMPTMYDIAGSADFWNKTDYGIAMSRKQDGNRVFINKGSISVQKVKFKNLGEQGIADHCYNFKNGRFEEDYQPNDATVNESSSWDNHNWITAKNIDPFND
jgi:twinkle protein